MKFKFEPNLKYQLDAIDSVVRLFEGSQHIKPEDTVFNEVSANILTLPKNAIFENFDKVVESNKISDPKKNHDLDFSVEMETGTGKTYVYLRTIYELQIKYGLTKFIIVVPSVAIKQGVLKTFEQTKEHFEQLYNVTPKVFEYDSKKLSQVRHYCYSSTLSIMVMNTQSFNSDDNLINRERDQNYGVKLIDLIKRTRPIVIMDEPQVGMDTENMIERFRTLEPLFKLRYSATHRISKNLVHRLTPYEAYNNNLVKKIEVMSIHETDTQSNVYIKFEDIKLDSKGALPQAKLKVSYKLSSGDFKIKTAYFKKGESIEDKTKNPVYKGWIVERVVKDPFEDSTKCFFSNGVVLNKGKQHGFDKKSVFREQIKRTIQSHFKKKETLKEQGIKVLSLFFIDRVSNYVDNDGLIRRLFEEQYRVVYKSKYSNEPIDLTKVHNGYFSQTQKGEYTDNKSSMSKNSDIYDLILKDKERLLSFEEPLEFVFSHSALGVGWDNPNIFNICTLNETASYIKKRQEIGRGLRICLNQQGERVRNTQDNEPNTLTVVANESYHAFVSNYQDELKNEYGESVEVPDIENANKEPTKLTLQKDKFDSEQFKSLWQKIAKKTDYTVYFDEESLINSCVETLNGIVVSENVLSVELTKISGMQEDAFEEKSIGQTTASINSIQAPIDVIEELAKSTSLSHKTVKDILARVSNLSQLTKNPMAYIVSATPRIKAVLHKEMVRLVKYESLNDILSLNNFKQVIETKKKTVSTARGLYDKVIVDSIVEEQFSLELNNENKVRVFLKLPEWYQIDTPVGKYNPDFALVVEKQDLDTGLGSNYYFVVETKGSKEWEGLREEERLKIECAIKHFESIGLNEYLVPVDSLKTFNAKAREKIGISLI